MQNKNPQGNFDPIPESDEELEKYGVWVKAEPQDIIEEPETDHQALGARNSSPLVPVQEDPGSFEELDEIPSFDQSNADIFNDLPPLEDEESSILGTDNEEPESIDLADFDFEGSDTTDESEQGLEDLELDLDEGILADTASEDGDTFDLDAAGDSLEEANLDFEEKFEAEKEFETDSLDMAEQHEDMETRELGDQSEISPFDDVKALQDELSSPQPSQEAYSGDLLQKIALELSSIKEELVSLRSQLGELKREPEQSRTEEKEAEEDSVKGGFFDDEDDDTIALTGDELDNILNTADFTVEPPEDLAVPEGLDDADYLNPPEELEETGISVADSAEDTEDLLPEDGAYLNPDLTESEDHEENPESGIQTIEADDLSDFNLDTEEELSPLEIVPEINVLTESPEDTSYLDDEAAELSDGFEMDASPLEDVPLVEPDSAEMDIGLEVDDALAADSEENLPFMESVEGDEGDLLIDEGAVTSFEEAEDELVLSIDGTDQATGAEETDFAEIIDEIEDVEPLSLDPFEDETVSELELHKEGARQNDGSWAEEPDSDALALPEAAEEQTSIESPLPSETEDLIQEFEELDSAEEGLLGTQETVDLGGEDLESLETENFDDFLPEEPEPLDEEILDGLDEEAEPDLTGDFEEMEELAEAEESDPTLTPAGLDIEPPQTVEPDSDQVSAYAEPSEAPEASHAAETVPDKLKQDVKSVLLYLDQLLASLPEEKIEEFASSEYYDTYKKLFEDLGLL